MTTDIEIYGRGALPPRLDSRLAAQFTLRCDPGQIPPEAWLAQHGDRVRGLANASFTPLTAELMDRLPKLEIISGLGVGYDMIDVAAAKARGILVTHTPDVLNADVANYALLLLLAASRDLLRQDAYVRSGRWATEGRAPLTTTVEGRTIGIVGLGRIGRTLARKLEIFGGPILYHGRRAQPDMAYEFCPDLTEMAHRSSALILCLPGGSDTDKLISAKVLDALGPDGILVNVARGSVVDQPALIAALAEGRLGRAALDVFEDEPEVPQALRDSDRVILSPHSASATLETRQAMFDLTADNLIAYFRDGAALTPVPECREMR
ncbi:2-hydroxyacid dehydrogenase [Antarcticimicrobium sediminis]|uniref:2-hydroxyacid dehydrogenase n=1 Tax=Antarcticimicrobium sediminis TaxID=2546227 RepID=A0A4R5EUG2_9RHOB|nr:2-hydroxyacid dehydrogenase [Antarcticimicrobium sediminis]TDE38432.1 2-hydroxyacid dehydrogenase [Antarcticimicrobium sediminis]